MTPNVSATEEHSIPAPRGVWRVAGQAIALALSIALTTWALYKAFICAAGMEWPFIIDSWRDMGIAQGMLDGTYPQDPNVYEATLWYNPLVGGCTAAVAWVTGDSVGATHCAVGPWLNLVIPLGLFFFLRLGLGAWQAAAGILLLMASSAAVVQPGYWPWLVTYTPWAWAPHVGVGLLFVTMGFYVLELRRPRLWTQSLVGIAWGLTFMAHTAPAVVFGCTFLVVSAWDLLAPGGGANPRTFRQWSRDVLIPMGVAFVVSLPYSYSILWNYQFRMASEASMDYVASGAELAKLGDMLRLLIHWRTVFAVAGVGALWQLRKRRPGARIALAWTGVSVLLAVAFYVNQWTRAHWEIGIPLLVPGHHFIINLGALGYVLTAAGIIAVCGWAARGVLWLLPEGGARWWQGAIRLLVPTAVLGALTAALMPVAQGLTYHPLRDFGWHMDDLHAHKACTNWIVAHCPPESVFLCDAEFSLRFVMPAGRKPVYSLPLFTNPYVPIHPRLMAKFTMCELFVKEDYDAFLKLAAEWHVTHLLALDADYVAGEELGNRLYYELLAERNLPFLKPVYYENSIGIFALTGPAVGEPAQAGHE